MKFDDIVRLCKEHKYAVAYGAIGFVSSVLILTIGFFRTLLMVFLTAFGVIVGYLIDRVGAKGTWTLIKKIFGKK